MGRSIHGPQGTDSPASAWSIWPIPINGSSKVSPPDQSQKTAVSDAQPHPLVHPPLSDLSGSAPEATNPPKRLCCRPRSAGHAHTATSPSPTPPVLSTQRDPHALNKRRWWPPLGRSHGHQWAVFMTATGQFLLASERQVRRVVDTDLSAGSSCHGKNESRGEHPSPAVPVADRFDRLISYDHGFPKMTAI